ncbi:L-dopachrome tautomerase-related protein [Flavobacterium psychrotrophum]|uniref:L-dopachrome tautomerase-related protein n=1 Tax=Flavobacterium psychrotrophum TaxID=2294119 RepID=UPI000E3186B9|nr:L-dopachrome tautomerase-related protein [Flavobacterium psychrotrophum]
MKNYIKVASVIIAALLSACGNKEKTNEVVQTTTADTLQTATTVQLGEVFADSTYQLTGVAVSPEGRIFTNYPYWLDKHSYSVVEVKDGKPVPYPNAQWNSFKKGDNGSDKFVCIQAVVADEKGYLWVVDAAGIGLGPVYKNSNKVIKIKLADNTIERIYKFPENVAGKESYINDIRVDNTNGFAYMTSSSNGGIVVLNTKTGDSRFVLHDSPSVTSDPAYHFAFNGKEFAKADGSIPKINSDGIALTQDKAWLYYKPLTDDKLYRVSTALLRDFSTPLKTIDDKVEDLGHFITTDGMEFDKDGNLYLGDLEKSSIVKITPDLKMHTLVTDPEKLIWPDSYSISADGYLYISISQIQHMPWFNNNVNTTQKPYKLLRLKL